MSDKTQQKRRTNRVFKSLAQAAHHLGVEGTLFYFVFVGAVSAFNLFNSILAGIAVFVGGFAFGRWVTNSDLAFFRILARSEHYKHRNDVAKREILRVGDLVMLPLYRIIKPWKESAALDAHINPYGFRDDTTFLANSGWLAWFFALAAWTTKVLIARNKNTQ